LFQVHEHDKILIKAFASAAISVVAFLFIMIAPWIFRLLGHGVSLDEMMFSYAIVGGLIHILTFCAIVDCCWDSICESKEFILSGIISLDKRVKELARRLVPLFIALAVISIWGFLPRA